MWEPSWARKAVWWLTRRWFRLFPYAERRYEEAMKGLGHALREVTLGPIGIAGTQEKSKGAGNAEALDRISIIIAQLKG